MAENKGHCKHGEFNLEEGCPKCMAERMIANEEARKEMGHEPKLTILDSDEVKKQWESGTAEMKRQEAAVVLRPGEDVEAHGYFEQGLGVLNKAEAFTIQTAEDIKLVNDDLSLIAKLKKAMGIKKREYLDPLKTQAETIRETYSSLMDPILAADRIYRGKILDYNAEQNRRRLEQEDINRKRMEAAKQEMELKGELTESVNLVEVAPEVKKVSTDMGATGQRDNWKYEVVDVDQLPRAYMVPDTAMLNAIAKKQHDQKQIPGVRFYNEPIITVRAR